MAEKKVRGGFEVPSKPKKYTKYDGVKRPSWDEKGAKDEYKGLHEIIPELQLLNRVPRLKKK
jgi:hypothetical protein